jgi:hypothetical protein
MNTSFFYLCGKTGEPRSTPFFIKLVSTLLVSVSLLAAGPVWAVHKNGDLELDGNTVNDGAAVVGIDDWDDVYNSTDHALRKAFIVDSTVNDPTVFQGGVKDTQTLDKWSCVTQPVQNKSDILHGYGATYTNNGDLFFYAGADRKSNLGDSNMGVWLFQGPVGCVSNGASTPFYGTHLDGDLLVVAEFDNGGRVSAVVVYRWSDPDRIPQNGDECLGGSLGDCSDAGLPAFVGENCNDALPGDKVCGRTNPVSSIDAAWRPAIPPRGLYEMGINLTAMIKGVGCYANAIIETRSSTSLTATLKDFVALDLATCGTLTVVKETIGGNANFGFAIDPSAGNPASFSLAGGESRYFGTVEPDTYTLAEVTMPAGPAAPNGWNLTDISCTGGTPGLPNYVNGGHDGGDLDLSIDLNDDAVCTFTNEFTAPAGSITLQKNCDSSNPGGQTFNFALAGFSGSSTAACADGAEILGCGESITCLGLAAGNYTIEESVPGGWVLSDVSCTGNATCGSDLAPQVSITLATADNAVATFTNTENASITICKSTVPSLAPGSFDFTGDLGGFALADGQCTLPAEVTPDMVYDVTEAIEANFVLDNINCTGANWFADAEGTRTVSVTPEPGEAVSCTFTNFENPGYIRICKTTVTTSADSAVFEFELDGPQAGLPVSTTLVNGGCALGPGDPGELALTPAAGYAVSETAVSGWDTEISCVGSSGEEIPANINLSPDETVVCTFTNTQRGHVIVAKQTNPPGASTSFSFTGDAAGDITDGGTIDIEVLAGQYTSTETAVADWQLDGISCDDDNSSGAGSTATFNVEAGESVTCTFSNSYINVANGYIVVRKETNPEGDPQLFSFSGDAAGDIADNGAIAVEVTPGQYTSTEAALAGWDLDSISCDDDNSVAEGATATFNVEAGETVTCTFSNVKRSHIVVEKQTEPADVSQLFSFSGDVSGEIADNGSIDVEVVAGQYTSTEAAVANWQLDGISCDDDNSGGEGSTATFNVEAGETVTCTFSNSYVNEALAYIIVRKHTDPENDPQLFSFSGDLAGEIADEGSIDLEVAPGQYTSTEAAVEGWDLDGISCDDNNSSGSGSTATFNVEAGESVTCTFSNSKRGHMIVEKQTDPANDPQTFEFTGDLAGAITDGGVIDLEIVAGRHTSTETALADWDLDSIECDDSNSYGDGSTAVFNIEAGETVTCVFSNIKRASLTVVKTTGGEDDLFCFDAVLPGVEDSFCIETIDGAGDIVWTNLVPGQYGITEQALENWIQISHVCSDGSDAGDFVLSPGEALTCTFVNQRIYPPVTVNAAWALVLLTLMLLAGGWYFRPARRSRF